jgi:hypothetical protein
MENLIKLIEVIIWPSTLIFLVIFTRKELRRLFNRMSTIKYKELEASFEKELEDVERKAEKIIGNSKPKGIMEKEPVYPEPYDEKYEQLLRISEESPRAALLEGWIETEQAIFEAAKRYNIEDYQKWNLKRLIIRLIETEHYAKSIFSLMVDLQKLKNQAAHSPEFVPTKNQIKRYLQLTIEMALTFKNPLYEDKKTSTNMTQL